MLRIQWGVLPFTVAKTERVEVNPIKTDDGIDYLYSQLVLDVVVTLNPQVASFVPGAIVSPIAAPGTIAATSLATIRHYLAQPRQTLIVTSTDGNVWIRSPALDSNGNPFSCDVKGGPFCEVIGPPKLHSDRTWELHLIFTTYFRECPPLVMTQATKPRLVLSNRFSQNIDIDEDGFSVLITQGRVIVDLSQVVSSGSNADVFRGAYFFPVPQGFQRQIRVTQLSDGSTLDYTTVDTQKSHGYPGNVAQRIEIEQAGGWGIMGQADLLAEFAGAGASAIAGALGGLVTSGRRTGTRVAGRIAAGAILAQAAHATAQLAVSSRLPKFTKTITARCWGSPTSKRSELTALALSLCFQRIPFDTNQDSTFAIQVSEEVTGKFSEVSITFTKGFSITGVVNPISAPANLSNRMPIVTDNQNLKNNFNNVLNDFSDVETINGASNTLGNVQITSGGALPPPPGDGVSSGTFLETLLFQSLTAPCGNIGVTNPNPPIPLV